MRNLLTKLIFPTETPESRLMRREEKRQRVLDARVRHDPSWARTGDGRFRERRERS